MDNVYKIKKWADFRHILACTHGIIAFTKSKKTYAYRICSNLLDQVSFYFFQLSFFKLLNRYRFTKIIPKEYRKTFALRICFLKLEFLFKDYLLKAALKALPDLTSASFP